MKKLKILWFPVLVFIALFLSLKLIEWITSYPAVCDTLNKGPICMFLFLTGIVGTACLWAGGIFLAIDLQE